MNSESIEEVTEQEEQEELEEATSTGPGQLLYNKREALGMSVQEVADTMHITMHYVRALETDAHDKLPGDVFIRGYLRSYASLLGLEPTIVINVYNDYANQRESEESNSVTRGRRKYNKNLPWIVISGIAFVVVAIALWYFSTSGSEQSANSPRPATNGRTVNVANGNIANIAPTPAVSSVPQALNGNRTETFAVVPVADAQDETLDSTESVEPSIAEEVEADASVDAENAAPVETLAPTTTERLITVDGGGDDTVQIRFTGESMVQVDDANDAQLYRDVRVAGDTLRINGTAPFNVLLGDASNSELSLNGAQIDFRSNIRIDNSARLTIGL